MLTSLSSIQRAFKSAARLSSRDWSLLIRVWILLLLLDLALRVLPLRCVRRWTESGRPRRAAPPDTPALAGHLNRLIDCAARRHLYPMRCLRRSLVLQRLLHEHGVVTLLRIGARQREGRLGAHAWLELDGRAIGAKDAVDGYTLIF